VIAGWAVLDAIYMVTITIFGVGYGEVQPVVTVPLRLFTIAVIVSGCSALIYLMSGVVQLITEGEVDRMLGRRRMTRELRDIHGHVILCGYGRVGRVLAAELANHAVPFVVVDTSASRTDEAAQNGYIVFQGDASSDETLRQVGVESARALATVLPNDALNVFITLTARTLRADLHIIARGELPETESKLRQAGADRVVLPATIGAVQIADLLIRPAVVDLLDTARSDNLRRDLVQVGMDVDSWAVPAGAAAVGRTVRELERAGDGRFLVATVCRGGKSIPAPEGRFELAAGDEVVVLKRHGEDVHLPRSLAPRARRLSYRGASS